jgi:hypothetical protein
MTTRTVEDTESRLKGQLELVFAYLAVPGRVSHVSDAPSSSTGAGGSCP